MRFIWDADKAAENKKKHGVDFPKATLVFRDIKRAEQFDAAHSSGEERWVAIGSDGRRVLYVVYTERDDDTIRIISARKATKNERKTYGRVRNRP